MADATLTVRHGPPMTLQAIIIRAEGALANTEDLRRAAYAQVFAEAGFDWTCDRARFAQTAALGAKEARTAHYVRQCLKGRPESEDFSLLIRAMHRRSGKIFSELLERNGVSARSGVRDLIVGARNENVNVFVAASMPKKDAENLLLAVAGARAAEWVKVIATGCCASEESSDARLYQHLRGAMPDSIKHALVIEGSVAAAAAARDAGFPVITTRVPAAPVDEPAAEGTIVVDRLADLISTGHNALQEPLSAEQREELLLTLRRLHLTNCEDATDLNRSEQMRVADILKSKGTAVKTIEPHATVRAFAHSLRSEFVGAMPVVDKSGILQGIISERDLARGIAEFGAEVADMKVANLMTHSVVTCRPDDRVASIAGIMTQRRIRHLPVVVDERLVGLVSIGDVLKHRLDEVQLEANVLRDVARTRRL